tara:strand:+ start:93 stop:455 length:363 start_codon:yes stop_codon:yes gene_type:complete
MNTNNVKSILTENRIYFNHPLMEEKYENYSADMMNFYEFYKAFLRNGLKIIDEDKISTCVDKAFSLLKKNAHSFWENPFNAKLGEEPTFYKNVNYWFNIPTKKFDLFIDLVLLPSIKYIV